MSFQGRTSDDFRCPTCGRNRCHSEKMFRRIYNVPAIRKAPREPIRPYHEYPDYEGHRGQNGEPDIDRILEEYDRVCSWCKSGVNNSSMKYGTEVDGRKL